MTKTEKRRLRLATLPPKSARNPGITYTIQDLKREHKEAGGKFFDDDGTPRAPRTHGHPFQGTKMFIASIKVGSTSTYALYLMSGDKVERTSTPMISHAGAMRVGEAMSNQQ